MIRQYFKKRFSLLVSTLVSDSGGAAYYSFTEGPTFTGRFVILQDRRRVMSASSKPEHDRTVFLSTHRLFCPNSVPVALTDRIVSGNDCYEIITINRIADAEHLEIDLRLLQL